MLDKYQSFYKLSASPYCAIYTAFNRLSAQNVLLKRVNTHLQWNQVLTHRELTSTAKNKVFPKLQEILRHKGKFFFIYEKPYGESLSPSSPVQKLPLLSAMQLMGDLLEGLRELSKVVPNLVVLPQWIFFHRNSLRVVHYEPFLQVGGEQKHIATHDSENVGQSSQWDDRSEIDALPDEFKKAIVFHLGVIIYRFLTGKKEESIKTKEDYYNFANFIRQHCQRQLLKATDDSKLTSFITKMLSGNKFQAPTFEQVCNFFQSQARQQRGHNGIKNRDYQLQIELEKINISTGREPDKPKKIRNCCVRKAPVKQINNKQFKRMGLLSEQQIATAQKSKLILPYLSIKNSCSLPRQRNTSCINRHNPHFTPVHKSTERQHVKSIPFFHSPSDS